MLRGWVLGTAAASAREQAALETIRRDLLQAQAGLVGATSLIGKLKIELARLKRETYGASSEKLARINQLELQLEDLEESVAAAAAARAEAPARKPVCRPLPDHLPHHDIVHEPALAADGCSCLDCGGRLSRLGEDATEELEYVPASFACCAACGLSAPAAPARRCTRRRRPRAPLNAGGQGQPPRTGAGGKYNGHLPLYRQSEIHAR